MNKLTIIIAAIFAFGIILGCLLLWSYIKYYQSEIIIENKSNFSIQTGQIVISGQKIILSDISPGEHVSFNYEAKGDSDYNIKVVLENGKEMEGRFGYVTSGMSFKDKLTVDNNSITFEPLDRNYEK